MHKSKFIKLLSGQEVKAIKDTVDTVMFMGAHSAIKYLSPRRIVRVTRKFSHEFRTFDNKNIEIVLSIGRPNYLERDFIAKCKKAGETFPVKKIQLRYPPRKRAT